MTRNPPAGVRVREARIDDLPAALGVLDGAALETDYDRVRASVERGDALVAVSEGSDARKSGTSADARKSGTGSGATVVGVLVLVGDEVDAVAVRRRRRGGGIGSALVAAAAERRDVLVAEFDEGVRPFYEALGFAVEPLGNGRYRGRLDARADGQRATGRLDEK